MKPVIKRGLQVLALFAVLATAFATVDAATITIDDIADGIPVVTTNGSPITVLSSGPESLHFTFVAACFQSGACSPSVSVPPFVGTLLERGSMVPSDRLILNSVVGGGTVDVVFGSDPVIPPLPGIVNPASITAIEDGAFQELGRITSGVGPELSDRIFVRSDVEVVPEPATLFLLGSTMAGLGLTARWRRPSQK